MKSYLFPAQASYRLVQLTDCHLLASADGWYQGCQPALHLQQIVEQLLQSPPDAVLLTGDLTQDHSRASYQLLAQLLAPLRCPVFFVPGNHDDPVLLAELQQQPPFHAASVLELADWQLWLLDSTGATPAGSFDSDKQQSLQQHFSASTASHFWLFMHHHPQPLACFIDRYGLTEQQQFWQLLLTETRVRGLSHGHAHLAYQRVQDGIQLVGCPATSVQFLTTPDWQTVAQGPQWCEWQFAAKGIVSWQFKRL